MRAAKLSERLTFAKRATVDDGKGNKRGVWVAQFTVWADMRLRPMSEVFTAARVEGRTPYSVKVRRSPQTDQIATDWRATDSRSAVYNIVSPARDPQDRGAIHMLLIAGGGPE